MDIDLARPDQVRVDIYVIFITKRQVYEAYKRVKANGGAAGVDLQSLKGFEVKRGTTLNS